MHKKVYLCLIAALLAASMLTACATTQNQNVNGNADEIQNTVEETTVEGENATYDAHEVIEGLELETGVKVALIVKTLTNPFYVAMEEGMEEYVRQDDIATTLQCDNDVAKMLTIAEDVASGGFDIVLITPMNSTDVAPVQAIHESGAIVVVLDTPIMDEGVQYINGSVSTDNFSAGYMCGEAFLRDLEEKKGEIQGTVAIYENPQSLGPKDRIAGFEAAIADYVDAGDIEVVYREVGKGQVDFGLAFMENIMQRFDVGNGGLDAVMALNDPSAQGCANALASAGYDSEDCFVYGVDGSNESLDYIEQGIQTGTSLQYPGMMAARGLAIAYQTLAGIELSDEERFLEISTSYIDRTNCTDYRDFSYIGE